jgi:putative nucleotide binding protein
MPEENAVVIDFLTRGKSDSFKSEPLAQVIGTTEFTLLEVVPKEGVSLSIGEKIYVGKGDREKIDHIKKRISFKELTSTASSELDKAIKSIVLEQKEKFLGFYNQSRPITIRRHQLELLPGMGKKHVKNLLDERNKKPFESFEDIAKRVKLVPNPVSAIVKRIILELEGIEVKHYLFARRAPSITKRFDYPKRNF